MTAPNFAKNPGGFAVKLVDQSGEPYGVKHTGNEIHVLIKGGDVGISDDQSVEVTIAADQLVSVTPSGEFPVIDYAHHEIHEGKHFKAGYQDVTMDTDETIEILFTTPEGATHAHFTLVAQATGAATIEIFENPTVSNAGTPVTMWNRNRNSDNVATCVVTHTPTHSADGTKMSTKWIGGTGFRTEISGEARGDSEFILKANEQYLIRLTARADGIMGAIGADWYEHAE